MNLLLHTCCAPCAIYPVRILREEGIDVHGFFYRHNIHPYTECLKREETLKQYSEMIQLPVFYQTGYDLEGFLRGAVYRESTRCEVCYLSRLKATVHLARDNGYDAFSSTLLYSRFQKHDRIQAIGESLAEKYGIPFIYRDFRVGWKDGIVESKRLNLYRQQYCGCIYSEKDRYYQVARFKSRKSEAGGQKPEVRGQKPETETTGHDRFERSRG
jgi:hypothetical protein